jgi:hypothetical protein
METDGEMGDLCTVKPPTRPKTDAETDEEGNSKKFDQVCRRYKNGQI